jgi:hypothetical protein
MLASIGLMVGRWLAEADRETAALRATGGAV